MIQTKLLQENNVREAARIIQAGGLVGMPTETVYGLGANGLDPKAVARIFEAKGRPQDNPLILHIADASWLERYCRNIPPKAFLLAEKFWPGPLTMILPRQPGVPDRTTGGLDTVGMRCPSHPLALALIWEAGLPIAAPSGNLSGKPSPTTAQHMLEDMDGKIEAILDGGPCAVGVESTIVDLTCPVPRLLRPGGVTLEQLAQALGRVEVDPAVTQLMQENDRPRAPGMKYRHYAPEAPVTVVTGSPEQTARYILENSGGEDGIICFDEYQELFPGQAVENLGSMDDPEEQARRLFDALRAFDHTQVQSIWAQCPDCKGIGLAITNRLNKAAGFHIVEV